MEKIEQFDGRYPSGWAISKKLITVITRVNWLIDEAKENQRMHKRTVSTIESLDELVRSLEARIDSLDECRRGLCGVENLEERLTALEHDQKINAVIEAAKKVASRYSHTPLPLWEEVGELNRAIKQYEGEE